jgi:transposase
MARAYSMGLRKRVIEACDEGQTIALVGERFKVSASMVYKLQQRRREQGTLGPKPHGGRQPLLSPAHDETLRALLVAAKPDTTLARS